jgi:hypothetical protein
MGGSSTPRMESATVAPSGTAEHNNVLSDLPEVKGLFAPAQEAQAENGANVIDAPDTAWQNSRRIRRLSVSTMPGGG